MDTHKLFDIKLADFALLSGLSGEQATRLLQGAPSYDLPRGSVLFRQGGPCSGLHLIVKGQVKLSVQTARGDEKVIAFVGAPGSLGEVALLLRQPYAMTAELLTDSRFIELATDIVLYQLQNNAIFMRSMLQEICSRLSERTHDLENFLLLNGTQRVTGFFLTRLPPDALACGPATITLPAKKSVIASRLNLTQEHFSRILHEMQNAGLIAVRGLQIRLVDVALLRNYTRARERGRRTQK
jgi:CRP-like cAMP-binding protein